MKEKKKIIKSVKALENILNYIYTDIYFEVISFYICTNYQS